MFSLTQSVDCLSIGELQVEFATAKQVTSEQTQYIKTAEKIRIRKDMSIYLSKIYKEDPTHTHTDYFFKTNTYN